MSEFFKAWFVSIAIVALIIGVVFALVAGITYIDSITSPQCTQYKAIDGKPVCIEYQLNK